MNNNQILAEVKRIKENSIAYQKAYKIDRIGATDEIGGHVSYDLVETEESLCPSDQFLDTLFEECAVGLGFKYERR